MCLLLSLYRTPYSDSKIYDYETLFTNESLNSQIELKFLLQAKINNIFRFNEDMNKEWKFHHFKGIR